MSCMFGGGHMKVHKDVTHTCSLLELFHLAEFVVVVN